MLLAAAASDPGAQVIADILIGAGIIAYWVPAFVAAGRRVPNTGSIIVINLFLGWTVVGWVVALAMASRSIPAGYQPPARRSPPRSPSSLDGYR